MKLLGTLSVALISAAISPVLLAQAPESGYDFEAFDSPEGWAMAYTLASALNLGSGPAEHRGLFTWKIEAELASIPHLSKEQQRVGFGGFKPEDMNKSPVFGRARVSLALPAAVTAEFSWTPPLELDGAKPESLFGLALERELVSVGAWRLGGRLHAVRGHVSADVTCSRDVASYAPGSPSNLFGCSGPSVDRLRMNQQGAEVMLSRSLFDGRLQPFVAYARTHFRPFVEVEAPLFDSTHFWELQTSGSVDSLTLGARAAITPVWQSSVAFSYTPLSVIRPRMDNRQHDNFWSLRVSVARRSNNR
jgi:hypothetical protein